MPIPMPYSFGTYNMGAPIQATQMPDGPLMTSNFGGGGNPDPRPPRSKPAAYNGYGSSTSLSSSYPSSISGMSVDESLDMLS